MKKQLTITLDAGAVETILTALENEANFHRAAAARSKRRSHQQTAEATADNLAEIIRVINNQL